MAILDSNCENVANRLFQVTVLTGRKMATRRTFIETGLASAVALNMGRIGTLGTENRQPGSLSSAQPSSLTLEQLHDLLTKYCEPEHLVGCALSANFLSQSLRAAITAARPMFRAHTYPTSFPKVSAGLDVDTTMLSVSVQGAIIELRNFEPIIALREPNAPYRSCQDLTVTFSQVQLELAHAGTVPDALTLKLKNLPSPSVAAGTINPAVLTSNQLSETDFIRARDAILAVGSPLAVLEEFVKSIPVPGALAAMRTFGIGFPRRFFADSGYIVVVGPAEEREGVSGCADAGGVRYQTTNRPLSQQTTSQSNGGKFGRTVRVEFTDAQLDAVMGRTAVSYYYPKPTTFAILAESKLKPGFGVADSGMFLLFKWYYFLSAVADAGSPSASL
ncbi:MAG: hypothetical protein ACT4P6_09385 [Gemmatimonadaceae bacterium]